MKLENSISRCSNYIILTSVLRIKEQMLFKIFVCFIIHVIRSLFQKPCNCKQWLECQQFCEKHGFRIGGLEDLDNTSLNDVYEGLIHAAIRWKASTPYLNYQIHIPWKSRITGPYKVSEWKKNTLKTTDCCHTCVLVTSTKTHVYRRLIGLTMGNRGIRPFLLALRTQW